MTRRISGVALAALAVALCGCNSEQKKPDDNTGGDVVKTPPPKFDVPSDLNDYPAVYRRGKCKLRFSRMKSPKKPRREELEAFASEFSEHFFGECFSSVDVDAVNTALEEMSVQTGAVDPLSQAAAKYKADFGVEISYVIDVQPHSDPDRRDIAAKIIAKGVVSVEGAPHKGAKKTTWTFKLEQVTTQRKEIEFRDYHASVIGRCLAQMALSKIAAMSGGSASAENEITLIFQRFDFEDKTEIREKLKEVKGISTNSIQEKSADEREEFTFIVRANIGAGALRDELQDLMEEEWGEIEIKSPRANTLIYIKGR